MKRTLLTTIAATMLSSGAYAADVEDIFVTETVKVPKVVQTCNIVEEPIYHTRRPTTSETLGGAIVGGVIGNQFGGGSGKDALTVLGALIGADSVSDKTNVVGYTQVEKCRDVILYTKEKKEVYSHSVVTFTENGVTRTVKFKK